MKLDLEAAAALGNGKVKPALAWQYVQDQVYQAFEAYPEEAQKLMEKYQPPVDQEGLDLVLQHLDPVVGINNFQYVNQRQVDLKEVLKAQPVKVLELVLEMITTSSKWQSEVVT